MKSTSGCFANSLLVSFMTITTATAGLFNINFEGTKYSVAGTAEDVKFFLFNRAENGSTISRDITDDVMSISPDEPLTVVLHGFMGSPHGMSTFMLIDAYVKRNESNVIGVDWSKLAQGPWYSSAVDGADIAAKRLAAWLQAAVDSNRTDWPRIHLVGFSLGAQVAGITAKYLNNTRLGRITGLDPSRPLFEDKSSQDRLDMDDADFVMVVHSSGSFIAFTEPLGHVDFYPNGGSTPQPPCSDIVIKQDAASALKVAGNPAASQAFASLVCSHYMALSMWVIALQPHSHLLFTQCSSWPSFVDGKCTPSSYARTLTDKHQQIVMGEETPPSARGTYYMSTEESEYKDVFAPQISELINDGLLEYSKLFTGDALDQDKGQAEIEEIKPLSKDEDLSGHRGDSADDSSSTSVQDVEANDMNSAGNKQSASISRLLCATILVLPTIMNVLISR